jgi:hypothetical protein
MELSVRVQQLLEAQSIQSASGHRGHADGYVLKTKRNGAVRLRRGFGITTIGAGGVRLYRRNADLDACAMMLTQAGLHVAHVRDRQGDHLLITE